MAKEKLFNDSVIAAQLAEILDRTLPLHASGRGPALELLAKTQAASFLKKFCPLDMDLDELTIEAYIKFLDANAAMASVNQIPYPTLCHSGKRSDRAKILLRAKFLISSVLGDFSEEEWFAACKHSSGSSIGVPYTDTSIEAKSKGLTYTGRVQKLFSYYLSYDPQLRQALDNFGARYKKVLGSRAHTVPKDKTKVRMICIEPTLNMFFQQGLMHCLSSRLESIGLSFSSQQDSNRYAAWLSSITGASATIDWSSASDTVSYDLVKFLFPERWFYYMDLCRSPEMELLGRYEKLHMFSTMGNACTFPIETLVFWSIAVATQYTYDFPSSSTLMVDPWADHQVLVFGDDCIIPSRSVPLYLGIMRSLGFSPNDQKTFLEGPFRESCGGDFLAGEDVRPFFLTGPNSNRNTDLHAWLNIIFNRLKSRFIRIYGPLKYIYACHEVFQYIFSLFRGLGLQVLPVPTHYPDDAGLKIGVDLCRFLRYFSIRDILGRVTIDRHGSRHFNYLKSSFLDRRKVFSQLRYWMAIKGLSALFVVLLQRAASSSLWYGKDF